MATGGPKRKRSERVAALDLPPGQWERAWIGLRRRDVLGRIALALLAAAATCGLIRGWEPPLSFRSGYTPARDVVSRVPFTVDDPVATQAARQRARSQVLWIYSQDAEPLVQLRALLRNTVVEMTTAATLEETDADVWRDFELGAADGAAGASPPAPVREQQFQQFRAAFTGQENLARFEQALAAAFAPFERRGLLEKLPQEPGEGNQEEIRVYPKGRPESPEIVEVSDVLLGDASALCDSLLEQFEAAGVPRAAEVAERLFAWIKPRLKPTLVLDDERTRLAVDEAVEAVPEAVIGYEAGQALAKAGQPLRAEQMQLLRLEYAAAMAQRSVSVRIGRAAAVLALIFAAFLLCGIYMRYRQRGPLASLTQLSLMLLAAAITVALARGAAADAWRAELIPLMIFGMTTAIVYRQELALLLSGVLALIVVLAIGYGLQEFLLLVGVTTAANLNMGTIRSRSKLIYVGMFAGGVAALVKIGMGLVDNQPMGLELFGDAARNALWAVAAGFLMTGLLPFAERWFGALTDLSLLDLGDVSHPLLQELIRRAPSTYNHSVTVGTIAEAAADSIGARGLLVRVGAYFHDIGKMLKPGYFVENQGAEVSRHDTLMPAMSTLVIIAHIKDGADLARQYHLPQPIVDLVVQHHGTTLVEYFFDRAHEQQQADPNGGAVDERTYRYPGPKPQTKEAAVLMLADNVESASRTLVDPTPARIESLVRDIAERRLHGGQFDESGLTLRELRTIEKSLVVSLISIYHGRIKYPEQRTAG